MLYHNQLTGKQFLDRPNQSLTFLGMSGIGKTTLCNLFPSSNWFKYSADYRIGTRYLDEHILDNVKKQAMEVPFLADLLRTDSIYFCHNITTHNLYAVSSFLGKVGNPQQQGLSLEEFLRRQRLHHNAEIKAMYDVPEFVEKAQNIYGYQHFINDAGGSLSELEDTNVYPMLAECSLIIYLKASPSMLTQLIERAIKQPKPLYYQNKFFKKQIEEYIHIHQLQSLEQVNPDDFIIWVFPRLLEDRIPRYEKIANQYGITVDMKQLETVKNEQDILTVFAHELDKLNS